MNAVERSFLRPVRTALAATVCLGWLVSLAQNPADDTVISTITADDSVYDQKAATLHYWGNVHLDSPGTLDLRCEDFLIQMGSTNSRPDQITATTNVVLRLTQPGPAGKPGVTNVAYAFQAVFHSASNTVTLVKSPAGVQPRFEYAGVVSEADVIRYNRATDRVEFSGNYRARFKPGQLPSGSFFAPKTNAPAR